MVVCRPCVASSPPPLESEECRFLPTCKFGFQCFRYFRCIEIRVTRRPLTSGVCRTRNSNLHFPQIHKSVDLVSYFLPLGGQSVCPPPPVTTSAVSSRRWNEMEIIGTKSLPACHGMQSVLYIHMYWTQTCHRLWQPHSSRTKPILSAAQCAPPLHPHTHTHTPPSPLSDSTEMSIRTRGCVFKWFVFLSFQWSQFPQANKPGNYFISEKKGGGGGFLSPRHHQVPGGCHGSWWVCYFRKSHRLSW